MLKTSLVLLCNRKMNLKSNLMKSVTTDTSGENSQSRSGQPFEASRASKQSSQAQESAKRREMEEEYIRECHGRHMDNRDENF